MKFHPPLTPARLERRYKRFLADVRFRNGRRATAHCPNPGSMLGLARPGGRIWLSHDDSPRRKLPWTWELAESDSGAPVGVHTGRANAIVEEALRASAIPELAACTEIRRETRLPASIKHESARIDFLLTPPPTWVEVKSVTLSRAPHLAEFPDARTTRGAKHLRALAEAAQSGQRAVLLYLVQRADCRRFAVARDIDPEYFEAMRDARHAGAEILCYDCAVGETGIRLARRLPLADA